MLCPFWDFKYKKYMGTLVCIQCRATMIIMGWGTLHAKERLGKVTLFLKEEAKGIVRRKD